jgi:phosphoribosylformylglycinamidine synthase subunit PurS
VSTFVAEVRVMLKPSVNDPQGLSIRNALRTLGFDTVSDVRAGKLIVVSVEGPDSDAATELVRAMADKLLANPVIESFEVNLSEAVAPAS